MSVRSLRHAVPSLRPPVSGFWTWDLRCDRILGCKGLAEFFGFQDDEAAGGLPLARYFERIVSADRDRIREAVTKAVANGGHYCETYRVATRDMGIRAIRATGCCQYGRDGEPAVFPGWFIDVSSEGSALRKEEFKFARYHIRQAQLIVRSAGEEVADYLLENVLGELEEDSPLQAGRSQLTN